MVAAQKKEPIRSNGEEEIPDSQRDEPPPATIGVNAARSLTPKKKQSAADKAADAFLAANP